MNESDIIDVVKILKEALSSKNWGDVEDAKEYLEEFLTEYSPDDTDF